MAVESALMNIKTLSLFTLKSPSVPNQNGRQLRLKLSKYFEDVNFGCGCLYPVRNDFTEIWFTLPKYSSRMSQMNNPRTIPDPRIRLTEFSKCSKYRKSTYEFIKMNCPMITWYGATRDPKLWVNLLWRIWMTRYSMTVSMSSFVSWLKLNCFCNRVEMFTEKIHYIYFHFFLFSSY